MLKMEYNVLHFDRHTIDEQRLSDAKKFSMVRMDVAMVNVNWPDGTHSQFTVTPRKDGTYVIPQMMLKFLKADDTNCIDKECKAVVEMLKVYPQFARFLS
jgi:hypothetical protein